MTPRRSKEMNIKSMKFYSEHECLWDQFNDFTTKISLRNCTLVELIAEWD